MRWLCGIEEPRPKNPAIFSLKNRQLFLDNAGAMVVQLPHRESF